MAEHLLNATELAERLHVSRSQAYHIMRYGAIPIVQVGHAVRVHPEDVEEFIQKWRSKPKKLRIRNKKAAR